MSDQNWEKSVLERIAFEGVLEQRRKRRWGIFFKLLGFLYLIAIFGWATGLFGTSESKKLVHTKEHTAVIELKDVISSESMSSAERINKALNHAFESEHVKGVILRINTPGGSPVQANQIYQEIKRLKAKKPKMPIYAVVEDICASGGYYVASATDKIIVDRSSLVGSIGVIMDGFGFTGSLEKLGVERRLMTAGTNKGFLDPFSPKNPEQEKHAQAMLNEIHQEFINAVKKGRGDRLKNDPQLFSGLIWTGVRSVDLGLADGFGSVSTVARDSFKAEELVDYSEQEDFAERFAKKIGANFNGHVDSELLKKVILKQSDLSIK